MRIAIILAVALASGAAVAQERDPQFDNILAVGRVFQFAFEIDRPSVPVSQFMARSPNGSVHVARKPDDDCIYQARVGEFALQINFSRWPGTYRLMRDIVPIIELRGDRRDFRCHRRLMPDEAKAAWIEFEPGNCWPNMSLTVMGGEAEFAATMRALHHVAANVCAVGKPPY